ncbi:MAG: AsmA-like C-terminal region-containing protein [Pseudomonadota bacterium]
MARTIVRRCALGACVTGGCLVLLAAALALAIAVTLKRAERAPQSLSFLRPVATWAGARSSPVVDRVDIGAMTLERAADGGAISISLADVTAFDAAGATLAQLSSVRFAFHGGDVLRGRFGPHEIAVSDASVRIVRRADRRYDLDYGPNWRGPAHVLENLTGGPILRGAFERADLSRLRIDFLDEASGRSWVARDASASIDRTEAGYAARAQGSFDDKGGGARIALSADYDRDAEEISARLEVVEAPMSDIVEVFLGPQPARLSSMVSARAEVTLSTDGAVRGSRIDGRAGPGVLTIEGETPRAFELASAALSMTFDPGQGASGFYDVARFDVQSPALSAKGAATLARKLSGEWRFGVSLDEADFPTADGAGRALVTEAAFAGGFDLSARRLKFDRLRAEIYGAEIAGSLALNAPRETSLGVVGDMSVRGELSRTDVLSLWPKGAAWAARRFVADRVKGGVFSGIRARLDLQPGDVDGGAIMPDAAMRLEFGARDAEVTYAPGMRPLADVAGEGLLRGNSFSFKAKSGAIGEVRLASGEVSIPVMRPKGAPATFDFEAKGDAGDILEILNDPPLAVLRDRPFSPDQFAGEGTVIARIIRPNQSDAPRESYRYEADAVFDDLSLRDAFRGASLTGGQARVRLETGQMRIDGGGALAGAPVAIDWRQKFSGPGDRTVVGIEGAFGPALADVFGVPIRRYMRGDAPFAVEIRGDLGAIRQVTVDADLTRCSLALDLISWLKPPGESARLAADVRFDDPSGGVAATIDAVGANLAVNGKLALDGGGGLIEADFDALRFGEKADVALSARRLDGDGLEATIVGRRLNIANAVEGFLEGADLSPDRSTGAAARPPISLIARIDALQLRGGVTLQDTSLDFSRGAARLNALDFVGLAADGSNFELALREASVSQERRIEAYTEDIGALLAGVFAITSAEGGEGRVTMSLPEAVEGPLKGRVEARGFRIKRAPLLARVFAAGSLPGLSDLLTGDGIAVSEATAAFALDGGAVEIDGFRATGPSVGMTASGRVAFGPASDVDLSGAIAPAYGVNSLLGHAPLIGDLFVNRSGEGLIALAYDVSGPVGKPTISVNPLSALTPGVFRRMFEGARQTNEGVAPLQDQPSDEAPQDEDGVAPVDSGQEGGVFP